MKQKKRFDVKKFRELWCGLMTYAYGIDGVTGVDADGIRETFAELQKLGMLSAATAVVEELHRVVKNREWGE